jgi:hypothetical protein
MILVVQTDNLLKNYVTKIQELEVQLQQMQSSRVQPINLSRPLPCLSSHCLGNDGSEEEFGAVGGAPSSEIPLFSSQSVGQWIISEILNCTLYN